MAQCLDLLTEHGYSPGRDKKTFLEALAFNYLIGNCDSHAKNFSLLFEHAGKPSLAPLYDLVSTTVYQGISKDFAFAIGGKRRLNEIRFHHFAAAIASTAIKPKLLRRIFDHSLKTLPKHIERVLGEQPELEKHPVCHEIARGIHKRLQAIGRELSVPAVRS